MENAVPLNGILRVHMNKKRTSGASYSSTLNLLPHVESEFEAKFREANERFYSQNETFLSTTFSTPTSEIGVKTGEFLLQNMRLPESPTVLEVGPGHDLYLFRGMVNHLGSNGGGHCIAMDMADRSEDVQRYFPEAGNVKVDFVQRDVVNMGSVIEDASCDVIIFNELLDDIPPTSVKWIQSERKYVYEASKGAWRDIPEGTDLDKAVTVIDQLYHDRICQICEKFHTSESQFNINSHFVNIINNVSRLLKTGGQLVIMDYCVYFPDPNVLFYEQKSSPYNDPCRDVYTIEEDRVVNPTHDVLIPLAVKLGEEAGLRLDTVMPMPLFLDLNGKLSPMAHERKCYCYQGNRFTEDEAKKLPIWKVYSALANTIKFVFSADESFLELMALQLIELRLTLAEKEPSFLETLANTELIDSFIEDEKWIAYINNSAFGELLTGFEKETRTVASLFYLLMKRLPDLLEKVGLNPDSANYRDSIIGMIKSDKLYLPGHDIVVMTKSVEEDPSSLQSPQRVVREQDGMYNFFFKLRPEFTTIKYDRVTIRLVEKDLMLAFGLARLLHSGHGKTLFDSLQEASPGSISMYNYAKDKTVPSSDGVRTMIKGYIEESCRLLGANRSSLNELIIELSNTCLPDSEDSLDRSKADDPIYLTQLCCKLLDYCHSAGIISLKNAANGSVKKGFRCLAAKKYPGAHQLTDVQFQKLSQNYLVLLTYLQQMIYFSDAR